jgi:hemerythrin-like domain-containing protein
MPRDLGDLLASEHREIEGILEDLATVRHDRFPLAHRLIDALAAHTAVEQQLVYPAMRDIVPGGVAMANQAQDEHRAMRAALTVLERSHPGEADFEEALVALSRELRGHVPVEEQQLLPALRSVIGTDKMLELGDLYVAMKESLASGLQGLAPDEPGPQFRQW